MDGLSFDTVLNWMFCYFILHSHKWWGWLFLNPAVQNPHNPRDRVLLSASEPNLSKFLGAVPNYNGQWGTSRPATVPLCEFPQAVLFQKDKCVCVLVSHSPVFLDINRRPRSETRLVAYVRTSLARMVMWYWIPEWCSRTGSIPLALEIQRRQALIESDPVTLSEGKGRQKLGIRLELGNKPAGWLP